MPSPMLTPRERAVLAAVERRLTNPEIAAELYVSVRTVESHIASLRRKLEAESRGALVAAAGAERARTVEVPDNPLRGRNSELDDLAGLLANRRWTTLTGPGGVGKTRLALEFARSSARTPVVVELEHADVADVAARIAGALDIESLSGDPVPVLATALAAHPYVLVLDNIDRVGDEVGRVVSRVLAAAPDLQVLTTSRTPVAHAGETVMLLDPLGVHGPDAPAVLLLADRLDRQGRPLASDERRAAESIAARLDGVPLALELAASVARHLPLEELDARLATGFGALDRAAPVGKHRTLETAFEWTWDLLTDEERDVLRSLAALPRSFDLELAAAVTHDGVEGVVVRLLDHSLLVATDDPRRRFRLLAVMREFVHARTEPGRIRSVRERHALHVATVATRVAGDAVRDDSREARADAAALVLEINPALRWALAADHPVACELAAALGALVEQYGADADSLNALTLSAQSELVRSIASPQHLVIIGVAVALMDVALVQELATLALARAAGPRERLAAVRLAGVAASYSDDGVAALSHLQEAELLALELGEVWEAAEISQMRGVAHAGDSVHDPSAALAALEVAFRRFTRVGDRMHVNNCRYMMAVLAAENGLELDRANGWAAEAVAYAKGSGNRHELAHARLAQNMLGGGELTPRELVVEFRAIGDLRCIHRSLVLEAGPLEPGARIRVLEEAVLVAETSDDNRRRTMALSALAAAEWERGDRLSTFATLDRIAATDGAEVALRACPTELVDGYRPDSIGERRSR